MHTHKIFGVTYGEQSDLTSDEYVDEVTRLVGDGDDVRRTLGEVPSPSFDPDSSESLANSTFNAWLASSHR